MEVVGIGRHYATDSQVHGHQNISSNSFRGSNRKNSKGDDIKTRKMDQTTSLLKSALNHASVDEFTEALLLERYRDALLEQAQELNSNINSEIEKHAREIAPKIYGWNNSELNSYFKGARNDCVDESPVNYESKWQILRELEARRYQLENKSVSDDFFNDLQSILVGQELQDVSTSIIEQHAPWLIPKKKDLFYHSLLDAQKKRKKTVVKNKKIDKEPKKSIAKTKFEDYMKEREAELVKTLNTKFQANPIPASSLLPKYKDIMLNHGTKTTELREKTVKDNKQKECKDLYNLSLPMKSTDPSKKLNPVLSEALKSTEKKAPMSILTKMKKDIAKRLKKCKENLVEGLTKEHTFNPKITKHLPDFEKLQQNFYYKLEQRKSDYSPTIIKPFHGLTEHERLQDKKKAEKKSKQNESKAVVVVNHTFSHRNEAVIVPKTTLSVKLKQQYHKMNKEAEQLIEEVQLEEQMKINEKKKVLAEKIRTRINRNGFLVHKINQENKLKESKEDRRKMSLEYQTKLKEMNERIANKMCLFEEVELTAAKNQARDQVNSILIEAGLKIQDFE